MKFKCHVCFSIVPETPCPVCGEKNLKKMCDLDNTRCSHAVTSGIKYCSKCGDAICPVEGCNCHDVAQVSRVTGYLADVAGWGAGKRQELRDRVRYDPKELGKV